MTTLQALVLQLQATVDSRDQNSGIHAFTASALSMESSYHSPKNFQQHSSFTYSGCLSLDTPGSQLRLLPRVEPVSR